MPATKHTIKCPCCLVRDFTVESREFCRDAPLMECIKDMGGCGATWDESKRVYLPDPGGGEEWKA